MEKQEVDFNLFDWWKKVVLANYANFSGRARRAELWNFVLVNFIIYVAFNILFILLAATIADSLFLTGLMAAFYIVFGLGMLLPNLAVLVRRLHDINKSGWYLLFYFIPLVGFVLLLVWLFTDGDRFVNNYGDDPKNQGFPELDFTGQ